MNNLVTFMKSFQELTEAEIEFFATACKIQTYQKNEIIIQKGEIVRQIGFVESGMLRSFFFKEQNEITQDFFTENSILALMRSFINQQPSALSYQSLTESTIYFINYDFL
jgi:CRP-like cAMP-binding protein